MATKYVIRTDNDKETRLRVSVKLANDVAWLKRNNLRLAPEISAPTAGTSFDDFKAKVEATGEAHKRATLVKAAKAAGEKLEKAIAVGITEAAIESTDTEPKSIRDNVNSLSTEELVGIYNIDDWVALAKELKLKGNLSRTGEVKLINRIKDKLAE